MQIEHYTIQLKKSNIAKLTCHRRKRNLIPGEARSFFYNIFFARVYDTNANEKKNYTNSTLYNTIKKSFQKKTIQIQIKLYTIQIKIFTTQMEKITYCKVDMP